jgi:radical SAM superfamily enzyme YgiQ (UPF0313 family)
LDIVRAFSPDIIAYSITTGMHYTVIKKNLELKEKFGNFFSIFGGPHATFHPEVIEENEGIDAVCIGEGEKAIVALANRLQNDDDVSDIGNLWVKTQNGIVKNPVGELIQNLDELPFYDRQIFQEVDATLRRSSTRFVMVSCGCPYSCTYCFNRQYKEIYKGKGRMLRAMSVPRAIEEFKHILNEASHVNFIELHDDIFPYFKKDAFDEFCELYRKEVGLKFSSYLPPGGTDLNSIKRLRAVGCYYVGIGIESSNEAYRRDILKRPRYTNDNILETSRLCREAGLKFYTTNLVGLPIKNPLENDIDTLKLNIKVKPTLALSYILYPYPGTEISQYAIANGYYNQDAELTFNNKADSPLVFKDGNKLHIEKNALMFGIIVDFPFLLHIHRFLLRLPKKFWEIIYFVHRGYKWRVTLNANYSLKELAANVVTLFSYLKYIKAEKDIGSSQKSSKSSRQ